MNDILRLFVLLAAAVPALAADLPLGHKDFYPSPQRPVGWRGDGSGAFPGATPVAEWDGAAGKNVVWKVAMPGPSFSQPVVVGDKVFTLADPNLLICVSAIDGKVLWQKAVDHTTKMPPDMATQAREAQKFWDALFRQYSLWADLDRPLVPLKGIAQSELDAMRRAAEEHGFSINRPGQANFDMIKRGDPLLKRTLEDQAKFSLYNFGHWEGILTHTFATPVSDGKHVWVNMSNDQVACYDLAGKCVWLVWDRPKSIRPGEHHVRYAMSPILVGEMLIVFAAGEMRAYEKATGKKLWGVEHKKDFGAYWVKVGTPRHMRLSLDGKPFDVILSPGSGVYRVADGKLVGSVPDVHGYEGSTALVSGDVLVRKGAPDSGEAHRLACRFKATGPDVVTFETVWDNLVKKSGNTTDILFDGKIWCPQGGTITDWSTGKEVPMALGRVRDSSPSLGGRLIIAIAGGGYGEREKAPGTCSATVISLDDPSKATAIKAAFSDQRYAEDQEFRLRWRWRGNGSSMSNSSPIFAANRMFFRTVGYLWCIGDPKDPWATPANCPPEARVAK